jgi:hypothetical protein
MITTTYSIKGKSKENTYFEKNTITIKKQNTNLHITPQQNKKVHKFRSQRAVQRRASTQKSR